MLRDKLKRNRDERNLQAKKMLVQDITEHQLDLVNIFGHNGKNWSELINPNCFRIWRNFIFISDFIKHSIDIFTLNGFYVTSYTHEYITKPCGVVLSDQIMYIIFLRQFSWYLAKVTDNSINTKAMLIACQLKLACDCNSNIYLANLNKKKIVVYDSDLTPSNFTIVCLPKIKDMECFSQNLIVLSDQPSFLIFMDLFGAKTAKIELDFPFYHPRSLSVDSYGNVLISNSDGGWITSVGIDGTIQNFKINGVPNKILVEFSISIDSQIYFLLKGIHPHFMVFQR